MTQHGPHTYLVTGALGCIGAWTVAHLLWQGERVVSFDLDTRGHRLDLLLSPEEQAAITFVRGDLADFASVAETFAAHGITHVIHLAALQVPFCRADPVKGAQVNVVGTANVFEAARQHGVPQVAYASSIAIFGAPEDYPPGLLPNDAPPRPRTLYGVYKQANEGMARIYWQEHGLGSIGLRPYTVFGLGRDQGLTSDPTHAMLAAARGEPYHIQFGGRLQFQWASDVAQQFIDAARQPPTGAYALNMGGTVASMAEIVALIQAVRPDAAITWTEQALPFPEELDYSALGEVAGRVYMTPLANAIRATIEAFEARLSDGRIT